MGIFIGRRSGTPTMRGVTIRDLGTGSPTQYGSIAAESAWVETDQVWPAYWEAFYWFEENTPGRRLASSGTFWVWVFDRPEWATEVDVVFCRTGGRGWDGARGFGNNDGDGGRAWELFTHSTPLPQGYRRCEARIGIPGTTGAQQSDRDPHPSQFYRRTTDEGAGISSPSANYDLGAIGPTGPNNSTGGSVPSATHFGRSWPGGAGGTLNNEGSPYGGAGGGGIGAPLVGGDRHNGYNGAPGYIAIRFRSGPAPDGHTWPQSPDWANPQ